MIRAISKNPKKKANLRSELLQLRAIAADWMGGTEPVDPALYGKKSSKDEDKVCRCLYVLLWRRTLERTGLNLHYGIGFTSAFTQR